MDTILLFHNYMSNCYKICQNITKILQKYYKTIIFVLHSIILLTFLRIKDINTIYNVILKSKEKNKCKAVWVFI